MDSNRPLAVLLAVVLIGGVVGALAFGGGILGAFNLPQTRADEFNVVAKQFEYTPSTMEVKLGDRVVVHLTSSDVTHGFAILEYSVEEKILPGQTTTVTFTASKAGEFLIFCTVFCGTGHIDHKGLLIVEP